MNAKLACPVHPDRPARFDDALRSYVNHEIYFFSDAEAKESFDAKPWKWCGRVTDPVSHERFRPTEGSLRADHANRPYFFRSDSTRAVFLGDPEMYAKPKTMAQMKKMAEERAAKGKASATPQDSSADGGR